MRPAESPLFAWRPGTRELGVGVSSRTGPARARECGSRPALTRGVGSVDECPAHTKRQSVGLTDRYPLEESWNLSGRGRRRLAAPHAVLSINLV
eukprot:scaffold64540_cov37-Tisochrysis_lutea.AAC.1